MLRLRDIMTRDVMTFSPETTLRDASDELAMRHLGGAPVVAGRKVVGVVSMMDILAFQADTPPVPTDGTDLGGWESYADETRRDETEEQPLALFFTDLWTDAGPELGTRFDAARAVEWDLLAEHSVAEVMSRHVCALGPDADVEEAAEEMRRLHIHRVLVMEGDSLQGIVSTMDITGAVADHRFLVHRYVFDRDNHDRREGGY